MHKCEQPPWRVGNINIIKRLTFDELISNAGLVNAARSDDVSAVTADVDPLAQLARGVAYLHRFWTEVVVHPLAGLDRYRIREGTVFSLQFPKRLAAFASIYVKDHKV